MSEPQNLPEISVITIVMDEDSECPVVNLDNVPPHIALVILNKAVEALEAVIPGPEIVYKEQIIYSETYDEDL